MKLKKVFIARWKSGLERKRKKDQNAAKKHFSLPSVMCVGYFMQITQLNVRRKLFFLRELIPSAAVCVVCLFAEVIYVVTHIRLVEWSANTFLDNQTWTFEFFSAFQFIEIFIDLRFPTERDWSSVGSMIVTLHWQRHIWGHFSHDYNGSVIMINCFNVPPLNSPYGIKINEICDGYLRKTLQSTLIG